jgi:hypothetical protein
MKKLIASTFVIALTLWAGDFWQSKPYTEWSDKDVDKMLHNSPWARQVTVSMGGSMPQNGGGSGKGQRGGGSMGESVGAGGTGGDMSSGGGAGGGRQRGGNSGGLDEMGGAGSQSVSVILSWETSAPIRQARARQKYGSEVATSPEAKKIVDQDPNVYVIAISGQMVRALAAGARGDAAKQSSPEELKTAIMEQTTLSAKGKDPIKANNVQMGRGEAFFFFPRTTAFTVDDKEVEFSTKVGQMPLKYKFHLKDMVMNGKLEL